jgi:hypothetical protein
MMRCERYAFCATQCGREAALNGRFGKDELVRLLSAAPKSKL